MVKMTFGAPERFTPTKFAPEPKLNPSDGGVTKFDTRMIRFKTTMSGCVLELPFTAYSISSAVF